MAADRLGAPLVDEQGLRLALEQELQAGRLLALLGDQLAGLDAARAGGDPLGELGVVEVVEQVDARAAPRA